MGLVPWKLKFGFVLKFSRFGAGGCGTFAVSTYSRLFFGLDSLCPTPPARMLRNERLIMTNATNEQLELGFNGIRPCPHGTGREGRIARAAWWFTQMREVVERAMDWNVAGEPRPEQIWIPGAAREVKV